MKTVQNKNIEIIKKEIFHLFQKVLKQNQLLIFGLEKKSIKTLKSISENEIKINKKYSSLFRRIVYEFALSNSYGVDLRAIISSSYINYELERIADYTSEISYFILKNINFVQNISKILINILKEIILDFKKIEVLIVSSKTKDVLEFLHLRKKIKLNSDIFNEIFDNLKNEKDDIFFSKSNFFFQLRSISRIYDHLTNICEWILFEKSFVKFKEYQENN